MHEDISNTLTAAVLTLALGLAGVADGSWKVVFDRGCPECECPSENTKED
jgi:hypothetical protein